AEARRMGSGPAANSEESAVDSREGEKEGDRKRHKRKRQCRRPEKESRFHPTRALEDRLESRVELAALEFWIAMMTFERLADGCETEHPGRDDHVAHEERGVAEIAIKNGRSDEMKQGQTGDLFVVGGVSSMCEA